MKSMLKQKFAKIIIFGIAASAIGIIGGAILGAVIYYIQELALLGDQEILRYEKMWQSLAQPVTLGSSVGAIIGAIFGSIHGLKDK